MTIVEAAMAGACLALLLAGLFVVSGQSLRILQSDRQQSAATFCLQQRIEEMRALTRSQMSDAIYLRDNVLNTPAGSAVQTGGLAEKITVNSFPTATNPTIVSRAASGGAAVQVSNPSLASASMLRIDAEVSWPKTGGGTNSSQFTTVITNGGITR